jgi:hypothetical protein
MTSPMKLIVGHDMEKASLHVSFGRLNLERHVHDVVADCLTVVYKDKISITSCLPTAIIQRSTNYYTIMMISMRFLLILLQVHWLYAQEITASFKEKAVTPTASGQIGVNPVTGFPPES